MTDSSDNERIFVPAALTRAVAAVVAAGGSSAAEAERVAANLVEANLTGHDSHGVGMVPRYLEIRDAFPKTPSERIEKYRLKEDAVTRPEVFDAEREAAKPPSAA